MVRFLHAADLHLGMRITRFDEHACERVQEARFTALQDLRKQAAERRADFILLAGDVFDDVAVARGDATRAFPMLESSADACPVYIIAGNHDPLELGTVWDRDPWTREQPHLRVRLLREPKPVSLEAHGVTLFPCPLRQTRSLVDPTEWIAAHPRGPHDRSIRIGLAHGSLNIRPLPEDDHLIRADAADRLGLDYLALGHWHRRLLHPSADGVVRTAYSGTHEAMGFVGEREFSGWSSCSADGNAERFQDDGHGSALFVTIDGPGAAPTIEPLTLGRLRWTSDSVDMTERSLAHLIADYSAREPVDRTILRLRLTGVMDPQTHARLDELRQIVTRRYHAGSMMDADAVLITPGEGQLETLVGGGILKRMLAKLKDETQSADPGTRAIAEHALKVLFRVAWEEQTT